MRRKGLACLLTATMVLGMLMGVPAASKKVEAATGGFTVSGGTEGTDYEYDTTNGKLIVKTATALTITSSTTTDTIYINKDVNANITLAGVDIYLSSSAVGKTGIEIADGSTGDVKILLSGKNQIWCKNATAIQKNGTTGTLTIDDVDSDDADSDELFAYTVGISTDAENNFIGYAAIGGTTGKDSGNIVINGGTVYAVSASMGAAIGGGCYGDGSNITINGGTVKAMIVNITDSTNNMKQGAAIGGGYCGNGSNITINGGTVDAWFHESGDTLPAGIKSYSNFSQAMECYGGAGIGGGYSTSADSGNADTILITGGTVTAVGDDISNSEASAGIGASGYGNATNIKITGGTVKATGKGNYSAGIGTGSLNSTSKTTDITITGGTVVATGGTKAPGIGAGYMANANVCISGGSVHAVPGTIAYNSKYADAIGLGAMVTGSSLYADSYKRNIVSSAEEIVEGANNVLLTESTFSGTANTSMSGKLAFTYANGSEYAYNTSGMVSDADGLVYVWLPSGVTVSEKVSDGELIVLFDGVTTKKEWYSDSVEITADGYTISDSDNGTYRPSYTISTSGTKTLYFKGNSGTKTSKDITINIDTEAPTGTIKINGQSFTSINPSTGVNRVKKASSDTTTATISASDAGSGVAKMEYSVATASTSYTTESAIKNAGLSWSTVTATTKTITLSKNKNQAVYVRITDNMGKVTYLSSPIFYFDTVAPTITGSVSNVTATTAEYTLNFDEESEYVYVLLEKGTAATSWSDIESLCASNPGGSGEGTVVKGSFTNLKVNTTYTLYAAAKDDVENQGWYNGTAFTTPKKTASVSSQVMTIKLNGTTTHTYDLKTMLEKAGLTVADMGNVQYSCSLESGNVLSGTPAISSAGVMTLTLKSGLSTADSQNVKITFKSDNYEDITAILTVNTTTKTNVTLSEEVTVSNATYDGNSHGCNDISKVTWYNSYGIPCVYAAGTDITYTGVDNNYSSSTAPTNAGTYNVTFTVKSDNADYAGTQTYTYTISKADISSEMSNLAWYLDGTTKITSNNYEITEDGNTHTVSLENYSSKVTVSKSGTFSAKGVGNYTATVTFSVADNYYLPSNMCSETLNWSIVAKEASGESTGGNTGESTGGNTGESTGGNTGESTGGNTGESTGGNTGDNTGGNTGDNTGDNGGNDGNTSGNESGGGEESKPVATVGETKTNGSNQYKVTAATTTGGTVEFTGATSKTVTSVVVPASITIENQTYKVTSIAKNAFNGYKKLTKVTIPNGVTSIGANAFKGCAKLTSVTIPNSVTSIGSGAFSGCKVLKKVKLSTGITQIPANAFNGCAKLASITIPGKVTKIGDKAFYKCTSLKKITIPKNVTTIGKQTFFGCKKLKTITIKSKKLKKVGSKAIKGIHKNATIKCPNKSCVKKYKKLFKSKNGYLKTMKIK